MIQRFLTTTLLAIACTLPSHAALVTITNASFETPVLAPNTYTVGVSGWTSINGGGFNTATYNPTSTSFIAGGAAPDGSNVAMISANNVAPGAGISQTLSATLQANTTYTLTFDVIHMITSVMDSYFLSLSANGVTLASDGSLTPALTQFALDTIVFNSGPNPAQLGQALKITLQGTGCLAGPGCLAGAVAFDNVQLDASPTPSSVPEPSTFGFVFAGMALGAKLWSIKGRRAHSAKHTDANLTM